MKQSKLDKKFEDAFKIASNTEEKLPPDVMLQFYAYYKQATKGNEYITSKTKSKKAKKKHLRNAFKMNAWFQLSHLSEEEAKKEYIKLVKKHLKP